MPHKEKTIAGRLLTLFFLLNTILRKFKINFVSPFKTQVIQIVRSVPYGKVVSYGQVALYTGFPRLARQVGWVLNKTEGVIDLPWWRVVNNHGYISIKGTRFHDKNLQRDLLIAEGIPVDKNFTFPIERYRYRPDKQVLKIFQLSDSYIDILLEKYGV